MPVVDQIDCPYCGTKKSGFKVVGAYRRHDQANRTPGGGVTYTHEDWLLMSCGHCKKTISGVYRFRKRGERYDLAKWHQDHGSPEDNGFLYVDHHPKAEENVVPKHVAPHVESPFRQALSNIAAENFDAAGTMARKALEITTKDVVRRKVEDEAEVERLLKRTWLKGRIKELHRLGHLTDGLAELAQIVKDEGDEAAHDEEPYDEEAARLLVEYSQALLTYVYTIPGMVDDVRADMSTEDLPDDDADAAASTTG